MTQENVTTLPTAHTKKRKLLEKIADRYSVDPTKLMGTLKATCFKPRDNKPVSDEEMMALLIVADQYGLNPFTKEIFAFPDKQNGIVPVVGVDGWSRIINDHKSLDGLEFRYAEDMTAPQGGQNCPKWCEVVIYRKDREHPTVVREYLDEVYRAPFKEGMKGPWQTHTKRFLRHKALIQGARIAFGFTGIYDEDEAERIIDVTPQEVPARPTLDDFKAKTSEPTEMFPLIDEFGETVGQYSKFDLVAEAIKRIAAFAELPGGTNRLEAFMTANENFEVFAPRSEERQDIASAYNSARERCAALEADTPTDETPEPQE